MEFVMYLDLFPTLFGFLPRNFNVFLKLNKFQSYIKVSSHVFIFVEIFKYLYANKGQRIMKTTIGGYV